MKNKCFILTVLVILIGLVKLQAQQVIRLYTGKSPGSENWTWKEQNLGGYLRDVTDAALTAFVPSNPNGVAVIIAPGGGFHYLVYELEGTAVAKKLNEKGITPVGAGPYLALVFCPPVGAGIVEKAEEYLYSSAKEYSTGRNCGLLKINLL